LVYAADAAPDRRWKYLWFTVAADLLNNYGKLQDKNGDGLPDVIYRRDRSPASPHGGMCTYDPLSTQAGMLFAEVTLDGSASQKIRLLTTGFKP
jgi:hypothetical protein